MDAGVTFRRRHHEVIARLQILHTQTKAPNMTPFVKSADEFALEGIYQFRLPPLRWLGVFAFWRLTSELFPADLVRPKDTTLELHGMDGTVTFEPLSKQTPRRLTDAWFPLQHKQYLGIVLLPLDLGQVRITMRVGASAVQVYTGGGWISDDDVETEDRYEVVQLRDSQQLGLELHAGIRGMGFGKVLSYELQGEVMQPIAVDVPTALSGAALLNADVRLRLGIAVAKWLSVNYTLAVTRRPLLLDRWQVSSNILLAFTASWSR